MREEESKHLTIREEVAREEAKVQGGRGRGGGEPRVVSGIKRGDTHVQWVTKGQITDDNTTVGCVIERAQPNDK